MGVVVPCRGDAELLHSCLASLRVELCDKDRLVVTNSDGDTHTTAIAREFGAICVTSENSTRGLAIAAGVRELFYDFTESAMTGGLVAENRVDCLLVAHADMVFPRGWRRRLELGLDKNTELGWGAFGHTIADPRNRFRLLEAGNAWRATFWQIPFGDQAMFVRTAALKRIGGFPIQEKYEDLELALRLKAIGPPLFLDYPVMTSARHWDHGTNIRTLRNWCILAFYRAGWLAGGRSEKSTKPKALTRAKKSR